MKKNKRDDNPNANVGSPENGEEKQQRASLRSMEADLKVIVGNDGGGENPDGECEVFWYLSQTLASQSGYIDTLLSTSLPTNNDSNPSKDHKEIIFEDITPSQWERMVRFISSPLASQSLTEDDAMELAPLYDQYDFPMGIKICDEVLSSLPYFGCKNVIDVMIDEKIQLLLLAQKSNLKKTFHSGRQWLQRDFSPERAIFNRFTKEQISLLVPIIIRDSELLSFSDASNSASITNDFHGSGEERSLYLLSTIKRFFDSDDHVDIANPMFPSLLFAKIQLKATKTQHERTKTQLERTKTQLRTIKNVATKRKKKIDGSIPMRQKSTRAHATV